MSNSPEGGKRAAGADLVIPALAGAFAIYYLSTVWSLPWEAKASGLLIGSVLIVLVAASVLGAVLGVRRGRATLSVRPLFEPRGLQWQRAGLVALMIVFIAAIPYLGFTLTVFAFLVVAMWTLGVRSMPRLLGIAGLSALSGYLFFIALLHTRFPRGPLEALFGRLF